jgi:hypothetical protein
MNDDGLDAAYQDWCARWEEYGNKEPSHKSYFLPTPMQARRILPVVQKLGPSMLERYHAQCKSADVLRVHLGQIARTLRRFDEVFRSDYVETILKKNDRYLWQHLAIPKVYRETSPEQRHCLVNKFDELRACLKQYLAKPELHYPYLDWLFLDAVTACNLIASIELVQQQRHGAFYAMCGGKPWKILLLKSVCYPVMWALTWGGPGLLAWWISGYSLTAALIVGALLYAWNVVGLIARVTIKVRRVLSGKPALATVVAEQLLAYNALHGPFLHAPTIKMAFERATAKGMTWCQEALCILDRVMVDPPLVWDSQI